MISLGLAGWGRYIIIQDAQGEGTKSMSTDMDTASSESELLS